MYIRHIGGTTCSSFLKARIETFKNRVHTWCYPVSNKLLPNCLRILFYHSYYQQNITTRTFIHHNCVNTACELDVKWKKSVISSHGKSMNWHSSTECRDFLSQKQFLTTESEDVTNCLNNSASQIRQATWSSGLVDLSPSPRYRNVILEIGYLEINGTRSIER